MHNVEGVRNLDYSHARCSCFFKLPSAQLNTQPSRSRVLRTRAARTWVKLPACLLRSALCAPSALVPHRQGAPVPLVFVADSFPRHILIAKSLLALEGNYYYACS